MSAKANITGKLGAIDLPDMTFTEPIVGPFHLPAVIDGLPEHAISIAQAVTCYGQCQCRATVQKTGGQSTQTPIAQTGIVFQSLHLFQSNTQLSQRLTELIGQLQIMRRITQSPAHEKFHGQITGTSGGAGFDRLARFAPAIHQAVTHTQRNRLIKTMGGSIFKIAPKCLRKMLDDGLAQGLCIGSNRRGQQRPDIPLTDQFASDSSLNSLLI